MEDMLGLYEEVEWEDFAFIYFFIGLSHPNKNVPFFGLDSLIVL